MTHARIRLGAAGEELAASWYVAHGYQVLARNWRCQAGEIDLICALGHSLVICEVKTRTSAAFGHPAEAVTPAKQQRLRILAGHWMHSGELRFRPSEIRFDVAAVLAGELEVIEAAF